MNMVKHEEIKPNRLFMDRLNRFDNTIKDLMKKRVSKDIKNNLFKFNKCKIFVKAVFCRRVSHTQKTYFFFYPS